MILKLQVGFITFFSLFLVYLSFPNFPIPKTSGAIEDIFPESSTLLSTFNRSERLFSKEIVDALMFDISKLSKEDLDQIVYDLDEELSYLDGVVKVTQPASVDAAFLPRSYFYSEDNKYLRIFLHFDRSLTDEQQKQVHKEVSLILNNYSSLHPKRTGAFYLTQEVNRTIEQERNRQLPLCAALLFAALLFIFRNFRTVLKIALAPALSIFWLIVVLNHFGIKLGSVSQLSLPFILAVVTSYSVHVGTRLLVENTKSAYRELVLSILFAVFTTVVGLVSMLFMETRGVSEFALISSATIILGAWFSLVITPLFLKKSKDKLLLFSKIFKSKLTAYVSPFLIALTLILSFFVFRINVHTEPLDFLPPTSAARLDTLKLVEVFKGNHRLSIIFNRKDKKKLTRDDLSRIAKVQPQLEKLNGVAFVFSADNLRNQKTSYGLLSEYSIAENELGPVELVTEDSKSARIIIFHDLEGARLLELNERIKETLQTFADQEDKYNVEISGLELLIAAHAKTIMKGIFQSIACTLVLVAFLLLLVAKSPKYILVGIIPNIIPVISVLGAVGLIYQNMNLGAALVAVAALSIAVDGTFHIFLSWFAGSNLEQKKKNIEAPMRAIVVTTVILSVGFSSMAFSNVLPIQQFAILLSLSLIIGALADLILLPKILVYVHAKEKHRKR